MKREAPDDEVREDDGIRWDPRRLAKLTALTAGIAWVTLLGVDTLAVYGLISAIPLALHSLAATATATLTIIAATAMATATVVAAWKRHLVPVEGAFLHGALHERQHPGKLPLRVEPEPVSWPMASGDDTGGGRADDFKRDGGQILDFQRPGTGSHRPRPAPHPRDPRRR